MTKKILVLALFILASNAVYNQQLKKVSFVLHWVPQAQFAGYYVAKDLGLYENHGIDLTIIPGGPKISSSELLEKDRVDFALMWLTNAIQLKSRGSKIINISQVVNRSSLMLIAKKSSGIKTPQDMNGKKIGVWGGDFQIQPTAFFKQYNLNVKTIMQGNSINLFFFGGVDVTSAMWYNEYHTIINSGFNKDELNTFFFSDYGLNFPEEGIYCSNRFYEENPKLCKDFVEATLEGWKYAFENPEEAIQIVQKHMKMANLPTNKAHQRWMLARMKDLISPSKNLDEFETLSEQQYMLVGNKLQEAGLIEEIPSYKIFYQPVKLEIYK